MAVLVTIPPEKMLEMCSVLQSHPSQKVSASVMHGVKSTPWQEERGKVQCDRKKCNQDGHAKVVLGSRTTLRPEVWLLELAGDGPSEYFRVKLQKTQPSPKAEVLSILR